MDPGETDSFRMSSIRCEPVVSQSTIPVQPWRPRSSRRLLTTVALLVGALVGGAAPLSAATSLRMTGITLREGKAVVRWEGNGGPYQLLCRTNVNQDWCKVGPATGGTMATNPVITSPQVFYMVTSDLTPPAVPSGVQAQTNDCTAVTVRWNAAFDNFGGSGVRSYSVFRNGNLLQRVNAISNSIVDTGPLGPGSYTYTVAATDTVGNQSTPSTPTTVTLPNCNNRPPLAAAGPDQTAVVGGVVSFNGGQSSDADGSLAGHAWNFGDGTSATGAVVTHAYALPGTYMVTLTVTDDYGATGTDTAMVTVQAGNQPPVANAGPDVSVPAGGSVAFSGGLSSDPDGDVVKHVWSFGDGSSALGVLVTHTYAAPGTYVASLTVTDNAGATATDSLVVTVTNAVLANRPPVASAGPDVAGTVGTAVAFHGGGSVDPDGPIAAYAWDFGDGGTAAGVAVSHAYAAAGQYTVRLTVTDAAGATGFDTAVVTVTAALNQPPVASAGADQAGLVGTDFAFNGSGSRDPDGSLASYFWSFGDGTAGSGVAVLHRYASAGTYQVRLTVTDNAGAVATATVVATVTNLSYPPALSGTFLRGTNFGGAGIDTAQTVALDRQGNTIVAGSYANRPYVVKQSAAGETLWTFITRGAGAGSVESVAVDGNGDILLTGNFISTQDFGGGPLTGAGGYDVFLVKLSAAGAHLWSKRFGGTPFSSTPTESGFGVAVDTNDNSVVMAGIFDSEIDFGGGPLRASYILDMFVAKFTTDGSHVWSRAVGGSAGTYARAVAVDRQGAVFVAGEFASPVRFGTAWVTNYAGINQDMFLVKYSPAGAFQWVNHYGQQTTQCRALGVVADGAGDVIVTGTSMGLNSLGGLMLTNRGADDILLAKYTGDTGRHLWSKSFGGAYFDSARAVAVDASNRITLAGVFNPNINFGLGNLVPTSGTSSGAFVANFAPDGTTRWARSFGAGAEAPNGVVARADGRIYVVGRMYYPLSFPSFTITSAGSSDLFLLECAP